MGGGGGGGGGEEKGRKKSETRIFANVSSVFSPSNCCFSVLVS